MGLGVCLAVGTGVGVEWGVYVGEGAYVGEGVCVREGMYVGEGVCVGEGVRVGYGVEVAVGPHAAEKASIMVRSTTLFIPPYLLLQHSLSACMQGPAKVRTSMKHGNLLQGWPPKIARPIQRRYHQPQRTIATMLR